MPYQGLDQIAALRSGRKDGLKMERGNQQDFANNWIQTGEQKGMKGFKDHRFFCEATLTKRNVTF